MNKKYYLYRHIRLDKNEPFYIGIGTKDKEHHNHYSRAESKTRNEIWHRIVNKTNYRIDIVLEDSNLKFIKERESEFIKLYGRIDKGTGILANLTDGGESNSGKITSEKEKIRRKASALNQWSKLSLKDKNVILEKVRKNNCRKVINLITKEIYNSITEAYKSESCKFAKLHFMDMVAGRVTNYTKFEVIK